MKNIILKKKTGKGKFILSAGDDIISSSFFLPLLSYFNNKYSIFNIREDLHAGYEELSRQCHLYVKKLDFPLKTIEVDDEKLLKAYKADNVALEGLSFQSYKDCNIMQEYYKVYVVDNDFIVPKGLSSQKDKLAFFENMSIASFEIFPDGFKSIFFFTRDRDFEDVVEKFIKIYNGNVKIDDK